MKETKEMKKMFVLNALNTAKDRTFSRFLGPLFFLSVLTGALSGCTSMNGKFDCNVGSGGKCVPMNHINKMADYGAFYESQPHKVSSAQAKNQGYVYPLNTPGGSPIRSGESIQQIWIGPYEDASGNYHEPSYVYVVSKKGRWIGEPANAIQD